MSEENEEPSYSLEQIRKKAHEINCELTDNNYSAREIEIIGYFLNRIAASYLSYHTHKELEKTEHELYEK